MNLDYYCYQESENKYLLKVGRLPTVELLRLFNWSSEIEIKIFGATNFKKFGWATAQDTPSLKNVGEAIVFLSNENEIGLIEFEGVIANSCLVKTYQDSECSLLFSRRSECVDILKKSCLMITVIILSTFYSATLIVLFRHLKVEKFLEFRLRNILRYRYAY